MGDRTAIEWADSTWNPIVGCSRVSPGCDHCYAIGAVHCGEAMGIVQHTGLTIRRPGERLDWTADVRFVDHMLDRPLRWRRPRRVFVNSLSDVFHADVTMDQRAQMFAVMSLATQHTFQVLTKRSQIMAATLNEPEFVRLVDDHRERLRPGSGDFTWPLPNVWLGVSIETNRYAWRADHLRATPAAVRFVSAEPLLGPLDDLDLECIDWLIVGGESGRHARPMHPDWVRDLRDRVWTTCTTCGHPIGHGADKNRHVHTTVEGAVADHEHEPRRAALFFKQWGAWAPQSSPAVSEDLIRHAQRHPETSCTVRADGTLERPGVLGHAAVYQLGKTAAGRDLDGHIWDETPEAVR